MCAEGVCLWDSSRTLILLHFVLSLEVCVCFRLSKLLEEIMGEKENKSLIFVETKRKADEISRRLRRDG